MKSTLSFCLAALLAWLGIVSSTQGANYSLGKEPAVKFGVHEIVLTGDGAVDNPFDTVAPVKFSPPSRHNATPEKVLCYPWRCEPARAPRPLGLCIFWVGC